jgi:hypothetical protein
MFVNAATTPDSAMEKPQGHTPLRPLLNQTCTPTSLIFRILRSIRRLLLYCLSIIAYDIYLFSFQTSFQEESIRCFGEQGACGVVYAAHVEEGEGVVKREHYLGAEFCRPVDSEAGDEFGAGGVPVGGELDGAEDSVDSVEGGAPVEAEYVGHFEGRRPVLRMRAFELAAPWGEERKGRWVGRNRIASTELEEQYILSGGKVDHTYKLHKPNYFARGLPRSASICPLWGSWVGF